MLITWPVQRFDQWPMKINDSTMIHHITVDTHCNHGNNDCATTLLWQPKSDSKKARTCSAEPWLFIQRRFCEFVSKISLLGNSFYDVSSIHRWFDLCVNLQNAIILSREHREHFWQVVVQSIFKLGVFVQAFVIKFSQSDHRHDVTSSVYWC